MRGWGKACFVPARGRVVLPACQECDRSYGFWLPDSAADSNFLLICFVFCQAKALPVFDLRPPLGLPAPALRGKEEVLVLSHSSDARFRLGVLVESLENAREIHVDGIRRISHNRIPQQFLRGLAWCDAKKVLMLDLDCLISPNALRRLSHHG